MLSAITVTLIVTGSLLYSLRGRSHGLIARRPYNNRYNPAAAARDGRLEGELPGESGANERQR